MGRAGEFQTGLAVRAEHFRLREGTRKTVVRAGAGRSYVEDFAARGSGSTCALS
jgi:hypothetical protein